MIQLLPVPPAELPAFCRLRNLPDTAPVAACTAVQGDTLLGWCAVARQEPCLILGLEAEDAALADGLLRAALFPLYQGGAREYRFAVPPPLPLPERYAAAGPGELAQLFAPCGE